MRKLLSFFSNKKQERITTPSPSPFPFPLVDINEGVGKVNINVRRGTLMKITIRGRALL